MNAALVFAEGDYQALRTMLLASPLESCAIALASPHVRTDGSKRFLVHDIKYAAPEDYVQRGEMEAGLRVEFLLPIIRAASERSLVLVIAHSHPSDDEIPNFSLIDDAGEKALLPFIENRTQSTEHLALVVSPGGASARIFGKGSPVPIHVVGECLNAIGSSRSDGSIERWDRQVRIFGSTGQYRLRELTVGIVGLGGTGSIVASQLSHLGVGSLILVDPDRIEETNLNRVVNATSNDVGLYKTEVAAHAISNIGSGTVARSVAGDVLRSDTQKALTDADFIFGCTDSQGSRAVLNLIAYQYLIPVIDMGVSIGVKDNVTTHIAGRVQMLAPGLGCLVCGQALNWNEVRTDLMTEDERNRDPYIIGHREPQPAVISLNGTMASLAVTMFLAAVTKTGGRSRLQYYNGMAGTLRSAAIRQQPTCVACSKNGALARGDLLALPARP
jgi:molybdopterin-synthase adenylyltransferase